ncbi:MAG TPA: GNAT family N-acetyltransferase [Propionibacteriaceae bacterium]|nr:GNAT family N-acetyltransferase [Propionibacteriaceae bacterium]
MTTLVRAATVDDAAALTRLRASMFAAMGEAHHADPTWQEAAHAWFASHVESPEVALRVVEVDGEVVASAVGHLRTHLPSPRNLTGRIATISNVSTFTEHRGHGYARLAFEAVLSWARESGAEVAELFATDMGQGLYEAAGFAVHPMPNMRLRLLTS